MEPKNIIFKRTLKEYNKRYRYHKNLLKFTKKEVEDFDRNANTIGEHKVLDHNKWWFIDGIYYQAPRILRPYWFRNLNAGVQTAICLLGAGVVATAITVPTIIAINNKNKTLSKNADITGDGKDLVKQPNFIKQSDGSYKGKLEIVEGKSKDDIKKIEIKVGNKVLVKDIDYTISDSFEIVIKAGVINNNDNITIEITKKEPAPTTYTLTLVSNPANVGTTLTGAGSYVPGTSVTVTATAVSGYTFLGWYDGDTVKSSDLSFTYTTESSAKTLTAKFNEIDIDYTLSNTSKVVDEEQEDTLSISFKNEGAEQAVSSIEWKIEDDTKLQKVSESEDHKSYNFKALKTTGEGTTPISVTVKSKSGEQTITKTCQVSIKEPAWKKYCSFTIVTDHNVSVKYNNVSISEEGTSINIPSTIDGEYVSGGSKGEKYTVTQIEANAFNGMNDDNLKSIIIPNSVTSIGDSAFYDYNCEYCRSITIPNSVTTIGETVFKNSQLSYVKFAKDSKLESIPNNTFESSNLISITIPNSVTSIGEKAFLYCYDLSSVAFESNSKLQTIGSSAFTSCDYLTSITIPDSVTLIGESAFKGCAYLSSVTILREESVITGNDDMFGSCSEDLKIYVPSSLVSNYKSDEKWSVYKDQIEPIQ